MELKGELWVQRPVEQARAILTDVRRLAACVPGCTGVSSVSGDGFVADMALDLPLLRLPVQVNGQVLRREDGMRVRLQGRPGTPASAFDASVDLHWRPGEGGTHVAYGLSLRVRGRLALLGEALVGATSAARAREFEQRLRDALSGPQGP